jgi:acetylglutamate kinase
MDTDMNADNPSAALGKEQARVLTEALPYLHAYHGKTFVIDYARRSSGRPAAWNSLGRDLALLSLVGLRLVVVHRGDVLNAELVSLINRHERRAAGLSGVDGGFLQARAAPLTEQHASHLEIAQVDPTLLHMHFAKGFLPAVRPLGTTPDGQVCPMERDQVAAAIAAHLKAAKLIVMRDPQD